MQVVSKNFREKSRKISVRCHPPEWLRWESLSILNADEKRATGILIHSGWWERNMGQPLLKAVWVLKKFLKSYTYRGLAIPHLGIYPTETKAYKDSYTDAHSRLILS